MQSGLEAAEAEVVLDEKDEPEDWSGKEQSVDAVEDAAVARKEGAGVFDACATLDSGFQKITELGSNVEDCGEDESLPEGFGDVEDGVAASGEGVSNENDDVGSEDTACDGGNGANPGFAGAKARGELTFAKGTTEVESGDIASPDADHKKEDEGGAIFLFPEERNESERIGDVDEAEESLRRVGKDLDEGRAEAVPGEESEGESAENGELCFNGKVGKSDDEG